MHGSDGVKLGGEVSQAKWFRYRAGNSRSRWHTSSRSARVTNPHHDSDDLFSRAEFSARPPVYVSQRSSSGNYASVSHFGECRRQLVFVSCRRKLAIMRRPRRRNFRDGHPQEIAGAIFTQGHRRQNARSRSMSPEHQPGPHVSMISIVE